MIPAASVRAIVVADPESVLGVPETADRVRRLGITDVVVVGTSGRPVRLEELAGCLRGRTLIVDAGLIVADACLGQLVDDPATRSGILVAPGLANGTAQEVRVAHGRVTSAGSTFHRVSGATDSFLGAIVVAESDAEAAGVALRNAAGAPPMPGADPIDLAAVALVRSQLPVKAVAAVGPVLRGGLAEDRAPVLARLQGLDEARVLLERANRPDDGFYSTFVLRRASKPVTALALRLGLRPNQISVLSLGVGLTAAVCLATGHWIWMLVGALLMQASLIIDCVDGEVARFTRTFSDFGAWLDAATDRVKEYAAYAGLAIGAGRNGRDVWLLATLVMIMQTFRHLGDYNFSRVQRIREGWVPAHPYTDPGDGAPAGTGATLAVSARLSSRSWGRWVKKVIHMPIGERWLVLSVGAVTVGPRGTFMALLGLGLMALAYTTVGRVLRTINWKHPAERSGAALLEPQLDLGPLGEPLWRLMGPRPLAAAVGWAWPAVMRLVELGGVWIVVAVLAPSHGALLFAWVFVIAYHHYDTLYRALAGSRPPRWLVWGGLGWDGRSIVVILAGASGATALANLLGWGSAALAVLFVVAASIQWIRSMRVPNA